MICFIILLKKWSFKRSQADSCLYLLETEDFKIYLLLYVDDIIIAGNKVNKMLEIVVALQKKFKMKDLGELKSCLEIKITKFENGLFLNQEIYLKRLLKRFNMEDCKPVKTPMETKFINDSNQQIGDYKPYRELVGCLMYLTQTTRPDLCFAVNYFSRFR